MRTLTKDDLVHYDRGANILARGSGSAIPFMQSALDDNSTELPALMDPQDIRGHFASIVKIGATGTPLDWGRYCLQALELLLESSDVPLSQLDGLPPIEINRSQMDRALYVCALLDKPMIDADFVGFTAIPSIPLALAVERGISLRSSYLVLEHGEQGLREKSRGLEPDAYGFDAARTLELKYRHLAKQAGVAAALFLTNDPAKLFAHSVTRTISLGCAIGTVNPVADVLAATGGKLLGFGTLTALGDHSGTDKDFNVKTVTIGTMEIGVVNEYLFVDVGGQRISRAPQIIAILDAQGYGVRTVELDGLLGHELYVVEIPPAHPISQLCVQEWDRIFALHGDLVAKTLDIRGRTPINCLDLVTHQAQT